jgi:hypothetical protein
MRRRAVCLSLIGAFLFGIALSDLPQLHERLHPDANQPQHQCAVSLIASGNYEHVAAAPVIESPIASAKFSVPALTSIRVAPLFLSARIFEHAPPVLA